jgi:quinol-cytochrome oxidoreductase complex cytochrome b subunit
MWQNLRTWFRERVPVKWEVFEELAREPIPYHIKSWFYCLGGTPLMLFLIQVVTGILLTFYYVPSPDHAYESIRHVTEDVPFGWWVRGLHHWAANLMILAVFLHTVRVFITGAYRRPRELNWMVGLGLLATTLTFGFTGYSLVYNQLSYWATTVGTNIAGETPLVGPHLLAFLRGGGTVTSNTLTRFFTLHIGGLPTAMVVLLALHILLIRTHGVTRLEEDLDEATLKAREQHRRGTFPFFPDHFVTELIIGLFVLTLLTCATVLFPVQMGEPADPLRTPEHIKPEWYFYAMFRWLKLVPLKVGILTTMGFFTVLFFWPFVDGRLRRRFPKTELGTGLGAVMALVIIALMIWEAVV